MATYGKRLVEVDSNTLSNDPGMADMFTQMGDTVCPVDMNGAYVAEKGNADNLDKTQANIRRRFNLGGED